MANETVVNHMEQGGAKWDIGGVLNFVTGGSMQINGVASGLVVCGEAGITGAALVTSGLTTVTAVVVGMKSDPHTLGGMWVSALPSSTVASKVLISVWKPTANDNVTPVASASLATVQFVAVGSI